MRDPEEVAFENYMRQIGDEIKRELSHQNINLMLNPTAVKKVYEIMKYFKAIQESDVDDYYGIKSVILRPPVGLLNYDARIVVNFECFGRGKTLYKEFFEILELSDTFTFCVGYDNETVTLNLLIEHYLVEV